MRIESLFKRIKDLREVQQHQQHHRYHELPAAHAETGLIDLFPDQLITV